MERNQKIPLYKVRDFGEKLNVTITFVKRHWRLLLKNSVYLLLPLSLVQAFLLNTLFSSFIMELGGADSAPDVPWTTILSYVGYIFFFIVGSMISSSLVYAMMRYERESPTGLSQASLGDLRPLLLHNIKRSMIMGLVGMFMALVIMFLLGISIFAGVLSFFLLVAGVFIVLVVGLLPMMLATPVYLFEDQRTVFSAIKRAYTYGWEAWMATLLLTFVIGFIVNILQSVTMMPWYVATVIKMFLVLDGDSSSFVHSGLYSFMLYLLAVLETFGSYLSSLLMAVALGYQYGSVADEQDGFSVDEGISQFESMTEDHLLENFENL